MDERDITIEQLAKTLKHKVREKYGCKYIRFDYKGYFRAGTYYDIIIYKHKKLRNFYVHVYINMPKETIQWIITEQNAVKIVVKQAIEDAIRKILIKNKKEYEKGNSSNERSV